MTAADLDGIRAKLAEEFHGGSRVTNCVSHSSRPFDARPSDCKLCATDIVNHMMLAIKINAFLNEQNDAAKALLHHLDAAQTAKADIRERAAKVAEQVSPEKIRINHTGNDDLDYVDLYRWNDGKEIATAIRAMEV